MNPAASAALSAAGLQPLSSQPIGSGASGSVLRVQTASGPVVIKTSRTADLRPEAQSLIYLRDHSALPVPTVLHASEHALILQDMPGAPGAGNAEPHAAQLLAALHAITAPQYGLGFDNTIGPLHQPNTQSDSWPTFFRDHRILSMTHAAAAEGAIPARLAANLERLAAKLDSLLPESPPASLIHGDLWSGNILCRGTTITALLDPAPYHAHAEVELAFITLFYTMGPTFFNAYHQLRPIDKGFWTTRRDLYNLYPLLVHARLFQGHYVTQLESTVNRFL